MTSWRAWLSQASSSSAVARWLVSGLVCELEPLFNGHPGFHARCSSERSAYLTGGRSIKFCFVEKLFDRENPDTRILIGHLSDWYRSYRDSPAEARRRVRLQPVQHPGVRQERHLVGASYEVGVSDVFDPNIACSSPSAGVCSVRVLLRNTARTQYVGSLSGRTSDSNAPARSPVHGCSLGIFGRLLPFYCSPSDARIASARTGSPVRAAGNPLVEETTAAVPFPWPAAPQWAALLQH